MDLKSKYWIRIKKNIENLYEKKQIKQNYSYKDFCEEFIPSKKSLEFPVADECLCGHEIVHNYTYTNDFNNDTFILGSCCIETFSKIYQKQRICIDCDIKIKINKQNRCADCRKKNKEKLKKEEEKNKEKLKKEEEKKCKDCGYEKKDNKYKYCFYCFKKRQSSR
jgi:hypothetical protein